MSEAGRFSGDGGYSFVEVLVGVVLLGLTFVTAMGGLATSITVTDYHRQEVEVETVLGSALEKVKAAPYEVSCPQAESSYRSEAEAAATSAGWATSQITVEEPRTWDWLAGDYAAGCVDTSNELLRLQLVTITVDHPDGRVSGTASVAKRG